MAKQQKSNREPRKEKSAVPKAKKDSKSSVEGALAAGKQNWGKATKK
jgi:hypothetical protein